MKNNILSKYQLTRREVIILWLNNYEFCEPLKDITNWTRFQSMDEFAQRLVRCKEKEQDECFRFCLNLDRSEENALQEYLLKRKAFVAKYILSRGSYSPYTHLYQLYLQYLPYDLEDVEKSILLDGYINMLADLQGENYAITKRRQLEKKLKIRAVLPSEAW